jgi:hypothetical protein
MNNVRSVPLALQFPLSEGFKPQIVEEDLISFKFFLLQPFVIPPFNPLFVDAGRIGSFVLTPHLLFQFSTPPPPKGHAKNAPNITLHHLLLGEKPEKKAPRTALMMPLLCHA